MEDIKEEIIQYLSKRKFITLATANKEGDPLSHTVAYINKGPDVYFSTNKQSRKVKNILKNPKIAYSLYDPVEHLDEIRSLQVEGKATLISEKKVSDEVLSLLRKKFPYMTDIPVDSNNIIVKITPKTCFYSDYIRRFGYREKVDF
jgi:nitroimidazol reductase NimA-like FMN-containing flavoprotein (pyridoxamine 5'-phosphate oxidase superfamily)